MNNVIKKDIFVDSKEGYILLKEEIERDKELQREETNCREKCMHCGNHCIHLDKK